MHGRRRHRDPKDVSAAADAERADSAPHRPSRQFQDSEIDSATAVNGRGAAITPPPWPAHSAGPTEATDALLSFGRGDGRGRERAKIGGCKHEQAEQREESFHGGRL